MICGISRWWVEEEEDDDDDDYNVGNCLNSLEQERRGMEIGE